MVPFWAFSTDPLFSPYYTMKQITLHSIFVDLWAEVINPLLHLPTHTNTTKAYTNTTKAYTMRAFTLCNFDLRLKPMDQRTDQQMDPQMD